MLCHKLAVLKLQSIDLQKSLEHFDCEVKAVFIILKCYWPCFTMLTIVLMAQKQ